jgi:hypothetical protein
MDMKRNIFSLLTIAALLSGCGDSTAPGSQVSLSFSGGPASAAPNTGLYAAPSAGAAALVITKAEVVLREIELKRVEVVNCDVIPEPDGCEKFEVGPVLINVPVDGTTATEVAIDIDPGMYNELEFEIHKVSGSDEEDAAFVALHPQMADLSIRVEGTFDSVPFTFTTDLDVEQEHNLNPALEITENTGSTNVTVNLGLSQWFMDAGGNVLSPETGNKGGENESLIKENIKQAFEAFEDKDRDGAEDS